VVFAILQQVGAAIDTYRETHDSTKAWQAGLRIAIDQHTIGVYGQVKAISNDDLGNYMGDYYANKLTGGIYGTVRAFNDGQIASGIVGAAAAARGLAPLAYGVYSQLSSSAWVSGDWRQYTMSWSQGGRQGEISAADQALLEGAQDGHLTLDEANAWWRHGDGADLEVDASRLRVHTRNGVNGTVQGDDYYVHGQVTLNPETGRIYDGAYDFERHQPSGPLDIGTRVRNLATSIGAWRAGEGTPFTIRYRGQPVIVGPVPHNNRSGQ
jgi:hypothetical protein